MPFSLYIHRTDQSEEEVSPVEFEQALDLYQAFPWKEEVALWWNLPDETSEAHRPLFTVFDDAGRSLALTAYPDERIAFAYEYPQLFSQFGFSSAEQSRRVGTDQFPAAEIAGLLAAFFEEDQKAIFEFVERHPARGD